MNDMAIFLVLHGKRQISSKCLEGIRVGRTQCHGPLGGVVLPSERNFTMSDVWIITGIEGWGIC
jgi:hypothetical protein